MATVVTGEECFDEKSTPESLQQKEAESKWMKVSLPQGLQKEHYRCSL